MEQALCGINCPMQVAVSCALLNLLLPGGQGQSAQPFALDQRPLFIGGTLIQIEIDEKVTLVEDCCPLSVAVGQVRLKVRGIQLNGGVGIEADGLAGDEQKWIELPAQTMERKAQVSARLLRCPLGPEQFGEQIAAHGLPLVGKIDKERRDGARFHFD